MESPVVLEKPPEYHGTNERGFPFDEEEGSGAWSELAARHPDIAARLRQRPATWARKRRPSSQDGTEDFGDTFGGFDRFPFDDIPPEFREHFPSHWNRRFGPRDEPQPQSQASPPSHPPPQPQPQPQPQPHQQTAATQTEYEPPADQNEQTQIPQYGLRNTVDLGQKSPADPSLVDAEERSQRSVSAPPESRPGSQPAMSQEHQDQPSNVRHIPIFVEGRDEPVINKSAHFGEPKPQYAPPPQPQPQPHIDRDQYFADDGPHGFHHTPNFSRAFGTPFGKGYRQGPQPFVQQKVYPQAAFTRGASPQRSQSPRPQPHPEEHFVKVPVHHEQSTAKPEPAPTKAQQKPAPPPQQPTAQPPPPQREATPPHPPQPSPNDPITMILSIQTDVLNLMTEVENFAGAKNDKSYLFLDEMLTRNLIKLDNIETEGKENIRQARKEAIKCIQKCIAVLEAKAESNANKGASTPQPQQEQEVNGADAPQAVANGEVEMKDAKEEVNVEPQAQVDSQQPTEPQPKEEKPELTPHVDKPEATPEAKASEPQAADTRPDVNAEPPSEAIEAANKPEENIENKCPKKTSKKRDKSKDKKVKSDSNKDTGKEEKNEEVMQIDDKGDKAVQGMDVDGAASQ